ncbi:MAG: dockerin type I repeat-containing protein, partial [Oscillospiraceae bacterium]|nr:dockerin type I repeat-containing protein [Oscillospiraceae bacterium]
DKQLLTDPEWLEFYGRTDAAAIAKHFGLRRRDADENASPSDGPAEAEILSDSDLRESANVAALVVALPFEINLRHEERLRGVWQGFESLSATGRRLIDQKYHYMDRINETQGNLIFFDAQKNPVRLMAADGAENLTVDRINRYVRFASGETPGTLRRKLRWQIDATLPNDAELRIEVVSKQNRYIDKLATGCVVKLLNGNQLLDTLLCVLPGDIDGDGLVTENDRILLEAWLDGKGAELALDAASIFACDLTGDGRVDKNDLAQLCEALQ